MLKSQMEYTKDIEDLVVGLADILQPICSVHKYADSMDMEDIATGILILIQKAATFIVDYLSMTETGEWPSLWSASEVKASDYDQQQHAESWLLCGNLEAEYKTFWNS